jgi:uncharacterized protein (TIGR00730 family)
MWSSLCVFCGSSSGAKPVYAAVARALGRQLAAQGKTLVYGGGGVGLMGELARAALEGGGPVIGVIPHALAGKEIAQEDCTELLLVDTMHERKARMADRADAFVALPGGLGTCDELFEILTWAQLGIHAKPVALLDCEGYFTPLLAWLDRVVEEGFLRPEPRRSILVATTVAELFERLDAWEPSSPAFHWVSPRER